MLRTDRFWGKAAVREMANYGAYMRGLNDRRENEFASP